MYMLTRPPRLRVRRLIVPLVVIAVALLGTAVWLLSPPGGEGQKIDATSDASSGVYYTCPMHPDVHSDHPGDCPICGMQLIQKTNPAAKPEDEHAGHAEGEVDPGLARIALSPTQRVMANIATAPVTRQTVTQRLETVGRIAFAESQARTISAPVSGRVESLTVTYTGQNVGRGQAMMRLYSPELLTAGEEYLAALKMRSSVSEAGDATRERTEGLIQSAEQRLRLLGMNDAQIQALHTKGTAGTGTVVPSPFAGTVLQRFVQVGQYVSQGQPLFTVMPLSQVWVLADVYEQDLASVRVGSVLSITNPATPDQKIAARVDFVSPTVDPATRTGSVRASLPNTNGLFKPGMYVQVEVLATTKTGVSGFVVPASALMETGRETVAWVEVAANTFEPRQVTIGTRSGDWVEIVSGLEEGQKIATSGVFLLDSEAQLRKGASGHNH